MELLFFGGACQRLDAGRAALNDGGHVVKVARTHFLLVRDKGVALLAGGELGLLHHVDVVLHAFAAGVSVGELEGVEQAKELVTAKIFKAFLEFWGYRFDPTHR